MRKLGTIAAAAWLCAAAVYAETGTGSGAAAAGSRLDDVIARGVLRVCTTGDYKPYSYYRADGKFEGIDIDMADSLARSLGVKAD